MSDFTNQQAQAINGQGNLLVVAGAGTGKTHTLIARCLRLIAEEHVSLENILLVTFTEAAAAEMRGRLREKLRELSTARPDDEGLAQQLALLDTARISTLHGFCLQLAREHFHALGLDPQFGVLDEAQTVPLQRAALDEILERHYAGTDANARAVQALVRTTGRGSDIAIRKLVVRLHAYSQSLPEPERWLDEQLEHFSQVSPEEWRSMYLEAVAAWRDDGLDDLKFFAGGAPAVDLCLAALESIPAQPSQTDAAESLRAVLAADEEDANWPHGSKGKVRDPLKKFFAEAGFLGDLLQDAKGTDPLAQDWEWARHPMLALVGLTREFTAAFAQAKRELGGVDFTDLEQCALRLLQDATVAGEWRSRLAHIFVDEYQDINAAQDAILTALSREGTTANRFLVGDVKQSIYRFRLANPKIFQGYQQKWSGAHGGGQALSLTENFRSREALLHFVNPLFAALMREEIGGVRYEALEFGARERREPLSANSGGPAVVELHLIAKPEDAVAAEEESLDEPEAKTGAPDLLAVEREARLVARRLRALKDAGFPIWDKDQNEFRAVQWGDMAVLLRSPGGRAEAFALEFNRAGVPLSAARDGFFASLEVSDLLNLLKLLDNPLQDVPLLAVLRSPLAGFSLDELAAIRLAAPRELFWTALAASPKSKVQGLSSDTAAKIRLFLDQFARWRELIRQTSLSQCLETALAETHYEALLRAGERGWERAANVRKLLDLARQFDPFQRQGLYRFLRFVQSQADEEMDLPPASPPVGDAVRLFSIHKSKGLEFPVVALAGMGTKFNEQDLSGPVLLHETRGLCPKITPPHADQSYPGLTHWLARRAEKRELRGEELRLLYVALTRARDALILVGTMNRKADTARWETEATTQISTDEVAEARSFLDWLRAWLPCVTSADQWQSGRRGENDLLRWQIYDGNEVEFAAPENTCGNEHNDIVAPPDAGRVEALKTRLTRPYPFAAATQRVAKTSVTALRREAEEADAEAEQKFFDTPTFERKPARRGALSAAEIGIAHHKFLQHFKLAVTANAEGLRQEAERLEQHGILSSAETGALDFAALAGFWNSDLGGKIRAAGGQVRRELPFTARFSPAELAAITGEEAAAGMAGEFVIVQGVADLAVLGAEEIWLVDFKTDEVSATELPAKIKTYSPQLKLYAAALAGIFQRPVTAAWLHFLSPQKSVPVELVPPESG